MLQNLTLRRAAHLFLYAVQMVVIPRSPRFPFSAVIGVTDQCNLNCRMCPRFAPEIKKDGLSEMDFGHFQKIVDTMPFLYAVTLLGMGEPLLHKDIFKMIHYAKKRKLHVALFTNGMLLTNDVSSRLISSGVDRIFFSIDGATAATVESIRAGVKFGVLLGNIECMIRLKKERQSSIRLSLRSIVMRNNIHELPALVELARRLGISEVGVQDIQYVYETGISTAEHALRTLPAGEKTEIRSRFRETEQAAEKYGIKLTLPKLNQPQRWTGCYQPWHEMSITSKGFVLPCCVLHNMFFGNIFAEHPLRIWNNERFIDWRIRMRSGRPPQPCLHCNWF